MKKNTFKIVFVVFTFILVSCSSDSDEPMPETKITYEKDIKLIIENNCFGCHIDPPINGAPFALVNYAQVSAEASNILTAISKQTGETSAMPPIGRMSQETIDKVAKWIDDGLLEN